MIRVLIVDDDDEKRKRIISALLTVDSCREDSVDIAGDIASAKRLLQQHRYDLLVLDIALPLLPDKHPCRDAGMDLLREIIARPDLFIRPQHIVGLTAYEDILEKAGERFAADLWSVIHYDGASDEWRDLLVKKARHIILATSDPGNIPKFRTDLCVITALAVPELNAVLRLPWSWHEFSVPNDGISYHRGSYLADGIERSVIAATAPRMGMAAAAVLATKMIETFRPQFLAMVGIAAGIRGRCNLGDLVVADPSWDWGSGKHSRNGPTPDFLPAPHQVALHSMIRGRFAAFARDQAAFDAIRREWLGVGPDTVLRLHIGPMASGAAVLADRGWVDAIIEQHRKLLAIEMETYGLLTAASESSLPQPLAFSVKAICDFADEEKTDAFQDYAAFVSASALRRFAESYLHNVAAGQESAI